MHTLPSVCPSIMLGVWLSVPHEIMSTLFFGTGGRELGHSCSVSLLLLFEEPLAFRLDFGSLALPLLLRYPRWSFYFCFDCEVSLDIPRSNDLSVMEGTVFVGVVR